MPASISRNACARAYVPEPVRGVAHEAAFTPYFALTERDRGRLTYLAKVDIEKQRERLPDGVPVEVELLLPDGGP